MSTKTVSSFDRNTSTVLTQTAKYAMGSVVESCCSSTDYNQQQQQHLFKHDKIIAELMWSCI